jgi:hypothetical protein
MNSKAGQLTLPYFCDVCGLPKKASEIFETLIISDVNKAVISLK